MGREVHYDTGCTGTATGGSSITLEDSSADFFQEDISYGSTVENVTDGSTAEIAMDGVEETKITFASALSGGTDNTFEVGDTYRISLSGSYGSKISSTWTCKVCGLAFPKKDLTNGKCKECTDEPRRTMDVKE